MSTAILNPDTMENNNKNIAGNLERTSRNFSPNPDTVPKYPPTPPPSFYLSNINDAYNWSSTSSPLVPSYVLNHNHSDDEDALYTPGTPSFSRALSDLAHEFSHYKLPEAEEGSTAASTSNADAVINPDVYGVRNIIDSEDSDYEDYKPMSYTLSALPRRHNSNVDIAIPRSSSASTSPLNAYIVEKLKILNVGILDSYLGREKEALDAIELELDSHIIDRFKLKPKLYDEEKPYISHEPVFDDVEKLLYQLYPEIMKGTIEYMEHTSRLKRNREKLHELNEVIQEHERERIEFLAALAKRRYS